MIFNINIVVISGVVTRIKKSYTKDNELMLTIILSQPIFSFDKQDILVDKMNVSFLILAFEKAALQGSNIKEDDRIVVVGKLNSYKDKKGDNKIGILADKIERHAVNDNAGDKRQAPWEGAEEDAVRKKA